MNKYEQLLKSIARKISNGEISSNKLIDIIKEAIDYYDPLGLFNLDAPKDEYLIEAAIIRKAMFLSKKSLSQVISKTFLFQFNERLSFKLSHNIAERIIISLETLQKTQIH